MISNSSFHHFSPKIRSDRVKLHHWSPVSARRSRSELEHTEEDCGSSKWSRNSCSVLHTPSWVRSSWPQAQGYDRSSSLSPSRKEDDPMEDPQEEHSSADLIEVASWNCDLCGLPPTPAEDKKTGGFYTAQDSDD